MTHYAPATLGGRAANGFERGQGKKVHAHHDVEGLNRNAYAHSPAICGQEAGERSVGWCPAPGKAITCPRCLRIIAKEES